MGVFLTLLGTPVTVLPNIFYFAYLLHRLEPESCMGKRLIYLVHEYAVGIQ